MLCVIAKINDDAAAKLDRIRKAALPDNAALQPLHAHITLASYIGDDERHFIGACKEALKDVSPFEVEYEKIEVLDETSIIAAIPGKSVFLESLHRKIAENYNDSLDNWTGTDRWYPHTTLFHDMQADLHGICQTMSENFLPFHAGICRIEFSRVLESGYEIMDAIDLFMVF